MKHVKKRRIARRLPARTKVIRRILQPIDKSTENGVLTTEHLLATLPVSILRKIEGVRKVERAKALAKKRKGKKARKKNPHRMAPKWSPRH